MERKSALSVINSEYIDSFCLGTWNSYVSDDGPGEPSYMGAYFEG